MIEHSFHSELICHIHFARFPLDCSRAAPQELEVGPRSGLYLLVEVKGECNFFNFSQVTFYQAGPITWSVISVLNRTIMTLMILCKVIFPGSLHPLDLWLLHISKHLPF